jgi:hypothetical protein
LFRFSSLQFNLEDALFIIAIGRNPEFDSEHHGSN